MDVADVRAARPPLQARLKEAYARYEPFLPAAAFVAGFLFDAVSLGRIDHWLNLTQQAVYLTVIGVLLFLEVLEAKERLRLPAWLARPFRYRDEVTHFLFGSLLSAYTIFFF